ncbi:uncharacterized protein [Drosophila tropicalis]|uniref:uncharacterized protein n=1 Tax=Drosophila tropicalis TaxID=46794 RepID=UPI0035ABD57E
MQKRMQSGASAAPDLDSDDKPNEGAIQDDQRNEFTKPSWKEWCQRNAKPIVRVKPKVERVLTPWQKPGPMKKRDWAHFFQWAMKNAAPKQPKAKVKQLIPCEADYLPCGRNVQKMDPTDLIEKIEKLAQPLQRRVREKHVYVQEKPTYSPVIEWGQPPNHDKGRPFPPPEEVPKCFPNDDIEAAFWADYRFPVRKAALLGRPSPRILSLAKPRVSPPMPPHCYIPEKTLSPLEVPPPKRRKFTKKGWRMHQIRLLYLARPVSRPKYRYFYS